MKPKQRQSQIAAIIGRDGQVSVDALAARFDVSTETIRRDLGQLAEAGVVQKVHGGAKRPRLQSESSFQQRMTENAEGKRAIAGKLLGVVERGDTLFIDTGSTTLACAEELAPTGGMTVITNSLRIAQVFGAAGLENAVYLLGGTYSSRQCRDGGSAGDRAGRGLPGRLCRADGGRHRRPRPASWTPISTKRRWPAP